MPCLDSCLKIAQNPFVNPLESPDSQYLFWSWLGPFLAWLVHLNHNLTQFILFHFFFSIGFTSLFFKMAFANFNEKVARTACIIFMILPVSATSYYWVSGDSITLFLMLLAMVLINHRIPMLFIGIALGMQHFEQSFFAVLAISIAVFSEWKFNKKSKPRASVLSLFILLTSIILGKLLLYVIFQHYYIQVNSGRWYWLKAHRKLLAQQFLLHIHSVFWSIFGIGWIFFLKFQKEKKSFYSFFLGLIFLCLLLPVSGDQTRVLAIVTFPLVYLYWLSNKHFLEGLTTKEMTEFTALWILIPWSWNWGGVPKWSAFPFDLHTFTKFLTEANLHIDLSYPF